MKTLKLFALATIVSILSFACKPTPEEAQKHNDDLIAIEHALSEKESDFLTTITDGKTVEEKKAAYTALINQADEAVVSVGKIAPFDNDETFLKAFKDYIITLKGLINNEYKQILDMLSKNEEEVTEEDEAKYQALIDVVLEKTDAAVNKIQSEQLIFATKYGFKVDKEGKTDK